MASIFTRIIRGEIPCEKILENEQFIAFLDIRPIAPGHTLVIPKNEINDLFDHNPQTLSAALPFAQTVAKALKQATDCVRVGVMVAGFEVPHAHIHLVPLNEEGELSFSHARPAMPGELSLMGSRIRAALSTP